MVLAKHQNYYPDISFVEIKNEDIKYAVDMKTTFRRNDNLDWCNGFTLGSHGEYFENRASTKNIQYPYSSYKGHFCLGIIYDRIDETNIDETKVYKFSELKSITSVIKNFQFFVCEKWKLASDRSGSGNTANIGSIQYIPDIMEGRGVFSTLGEQWFDDYWMNFNKISITKSKGKVIKIRTLEDFVKYRKGDINDIVKKKTPRNLTQGNEDD